MSHDLLVPSDLSLSETQEILNSLRIVVVTGTEALYDSVGVEVAQMTMGAELVRIFAKHRLIAADRVLPVDADAASNESRR